MSRHEDEFTYTDEEAAEEIKKAGQAAAQTLTNMGKPRLVEQINKETARRAATVCPDCK